MHSQKELRLALFFRFRPILQIDDEHLITVFIYSILALEEFNVRKIIHIDMDCYFAAVEMRDFPGIVAKPLAVGGSSDRRGVISNLQLRARKFGVCVRRWRRLCL